jgi:flagellar biosynthesis protein FlhF
MRIKQFREADMRAALERVREELGPDAVIVSTRTLGASPEERRRGLRGVEVIAGVDERPGSVIAQAQSVARAAAGVAPGAARAAYALQRAAAAETDAEPPPPAVQAPRFPRLARERDGLPSLDGLVPAFVALAARRAQATPEDARSPELHDLPRAPRPRRYNDAPAGVSLSDEDDTAPAFAQILREAARRAQPAAHPPGGLSIARVSVPPAPDTFERVVAVAPPPAAPVAARPLVDDQEARPGRDGSTRHAALDVLDTLCAAGLSDDLAEEALADAIRRLPASALGDGRRLLEAALARVVTRIPTGPALTSQGLTGRTVFFVGSAGAGKTTALLKAALHLRRDGADVGIVGADDSRLGAPEQLLRYGDLLRLPAEPAHGADDLARVIAAAPGGRATLVDTPAFTLGGAGHDDLSGLLAAVPNPVVVLTTAAVGAHDPSRLAAAARAAGATAVALTRLDEADGPGTMLNLLAHLRLPPLLCSAGRDVLAGITTPTAKDLAVELLADMVGVIAA